MLWPLHTQLRLPMSDMAGQDKAKLVLDKENGVAVLMLSGEWTVSHLPESARSRMQPLDKGVTRLIVNGTALEEVDTSGSWLIIQLLREMKCDFSKIEWMGLSESHQKIIRLIANVHHEHLSEKKKSYLPVHASLISLGKFCVTSAEGGMTLMSFFGQLWFTMGRTLLNPRRLRLKSVFFHANEVGIRAIPLVVCLAFFISLVLGYQGANQLKAFGAKEYTINLVAISLLREMGVLITAIMLAGRSCSAFAAQIGVMQMNDEVAAMRTLGLDPFELLVLPRVLAITLVLPALTIVADLAGLYGTYFVSSFYLGMSYHQFENRLMGYVTDMTFYVGLIKAPIFAFFIGSIGCYQGLQVRTSATELGLRTTAAVVQSIFWVVLADAVFSVIFTSMNL